MRLLLDTHAFLWYCMGDSRMSSAARSAIQEGGNKRLLSIASLWEVAIKHSIGKLELTDPFERFVSEGLQKVECTPLGVEIAHLSQLVTLPFHHRDPFDRLIVAQALDEQLPIVSVDTDLDAYGVQRVW